MPLATSLLVNNDANNASSTTTNAAPTSSSLLTHSTDDKRNSIDPFYSSYSTRFNAAQFATLVCD
jgi:hypothetical protein